MESDSSKNSDENLSFFEVSDEERQLLEEKAEIVRGFLQEREIIERANEDEKNDMRFAFEAEKENMKKAFQCEKEEMRQIFLKEKDNIRLEFQEAKHVLKLSFDDEKSALVKSWDRERENLLESFHKEKKEMKVNFKKILREKEDGLRAEKIETEAKIRKELERIEDVENELKRTLSQGLGDLENIYFEENAFLETVYNHEQPEVDMHFEGLLDAELSVDREDLLKSLNQEKSRMHSHYANKHKQVEHQFASEVIDMEQRFKQQKNDLMNIFKGEKSDMEDNFRREKEDIRRKFEVEFRRILQQEKSKFESEIQGYEHDISVLKYQKEQLEKCYSLEMQTLRLKFDRDRLEIENKFTNEKKDLKRVLKGQYERKLSDDKVRLEWLLDQFHLGRGSSEHIATSLSSSSVYSD
ncbi:hypothetical protein OS493_035898 [Desmophyllum pertusum]|uniref:Uncharacterized protein n=1 Tax=Desmophyllum pertusum TaxID=174260 RepID=A0A9W9Z753_9CNID|nr:hypothetical protein OS493_035898 [Desmophyllum pertusum]